MEGVVENDEAAWRQLGDDSAELFEGWLGVFVEVKDWLRVAVIEVGTCYNLMDGEARDFALDGATGEW